VYDVTNLVHQERDPGFEDRDVAFGEMAEVDVAARQA
jgi:hypothetical protein